MAAAGGAGAGGGGGAPAAGAAALEELESLQSIFDTDLEVIPHPTWGFQGFRIAVVPVTGGTPEQNRHNAVLRVMMSKKYPAEAYVCGRQY